MVTMYCGFATKYFFRTSKENVPKYNLQKRLVTISLHEFALIYFSFCCYILATILFGRVCLLASGTARYQMTVQIPETSTVGSSDLLIDSVSSLFVLLNGSKASVFQ